MPTPAVISAFVNAVNGGDTDAFLALFAPHGLVDDWGTRYIGHKQIRTWSDRELIGVEATLKVISSEEHKNEASVNVEVGGRGFNGPSRFAFTLEGALVKEMRITGE